MESSSNCNSTKHRDEQKVVSTARKRLYIKLRKGGHALPKACIV